MKRIILCADGTGNKGGVTPDTNVFRIFNAVAKTDQNGIRQITYYDKGVGTSSNKFLSSITGAFGFGLNRNIRELYEYLARHYNHGDEIYLFGFSRGAATVRAFAGMVQTCGLLSLYHNPDDGPANRKRKLEADFQKEIDAAMAFYVDHGVQSRTSFKIPIPEKLTKLWGDSYTPSDQVPIKFIGVWDTVSALGFPKDWSWIFNRFFNLLDKTSDAVWPHRFYNYQLSERVENVYHALALDDERRTFHPRVWREEEKPDSNGKLLRPKNIEQVWFSGVHSNVGGGYVRDGLSFVTLNWMIKRAAVYGLAFKKDIAERVDQDANVHGKFYDSRAGLGLYYRYAPRNLEALCIETNKVKPGSIKIHESVFDRMEQVTENYAPGQFPFRFQITKSEVGAQPKACQAAKDPAVWKKVAADIAKYVDGRRRLYTIFAESTLLLFLFSWFFWVITPEFEFSGDGDWQRHLVDVLQYVVPEFMEGLMIYAVANHWVIGLVFAFYAASLYWIHEILKKRTDFSCRQARDHLIVQEPAASNGEGKSSEEAISKHYKFLLVEGAGMILVAISMILISVNLLATFQGEPARICGDFSDQVVKRVSACGATTIVEANQYWNNSGLLLEEGVRYRVDIKDGETWRDARQEATATGWNKPETGLLKLLREMFARDTSKGLFHLLGAVHGKCEDGRACGYQFPIENGKSFMATDSGEFCAFANDLPFMYWNNRGEIEISISRVSEEPCNIE